MDGQHEARSLLIGVKVRLVASCQSQKGALSAFKAHFKIKYFVVRNVRILCLRARKDRLLDHFACVRCFLPIFNVNRPLNFGPRQQVMHVLRHVRVVQEAVQPEIDHLS